MHNESEVWFLDDRECAKVIFKLEKWMLLLYFWLEGAGMYRGDICRGAALFFKGGLYFDVDLMPRFPVWNVIDRDTELIVPQNSVSFFQAFVGAVPRHPVMGKYLDFFVDYYRGRHPVVDYVGCSLMHDAWKSVNASKTKLLYECRLDEAGCEHPNVTRQPQTGICNFVVADKATQTVPFYSRITEMC